MKNTIKIGKYEIEVSRDHLDIIILTHKGNGHTQRELMYVDLRHNWVKFTRTTTVPRIVAGSLNGYTDIEINAEKGTFRVACMEIPIKDVRKILRKIDRIVEKL